VSSFGRGFRNRNPLVLVAAVGLTLLAMLGFEQLFVTGAWTAVPLKYCLRNQLDSFVYSSWIVGANKRNPPDLPAIYVTGGSAAREAIVSGPSLAAQVRGFGGPHVAAWDLGCINQNFAESLAIADNVPTAKPAWVLVGINEGRFTEDPPTNEKQVVGRDLLLKSRFLQEYVSRRYGAYRYSLTILPGVFSYLTSYASQDGWAALAGNAPQRRYLQHNYTMRKVYSARKKELLVRTWLRTRYPVFKRNLRFNLAMLEQILVRCRQRGVHAVLLELPQNAQIESGRMNGAMRLYQAPVQALATKYGVPYLDFNSAARIPSADFRDLSHLVEPGRVIWQRKLAQALAPLLGPRGRGVKSS
jgi:hypothetical protein